MIDHNSTLMITVLRREYPDIATTISKKISASLPEHSLTDLKLIDQIVVSFKREKGVTDLNWTKGKAKGDITRVRDILIAVVLLFYQPEKLMQFTNGFIKAGLLLTLSKSTNSSPETLSASAANVIVAFKAYEDFKLEVYRMYELIKTENQFFK